MIFNYLLSINQKKINNNFKGHFSLCTRHFGAAVACHAAYAWCAIHLSILCSRSS